MLRTHRIQIVLSVLALLAIASIFRFNRISPSPPSESASTRAPSDATPAPLTLQKLRENVSGAAQAPAVSTAQNELRDKNLTLGNPAQRGARSPLDRQAPLDAAAVTPSAGAQEAHCVQLSYQHVKTSGHSDLEDCSQHRNLIHLSAPKAGEIFRSSLCVKANGKPVLFRYDAEKRNLLLAPVLGPETQITVRYCTVPTRCEDACTPEKDDFVEAIAGNDDDLPGEVRNAWGSKDGNIALSAKLTAELRQYEDAPMFSGWQETENSRNAALNTQVSHRCFVQPKKVARK